MASDAVKEVIRERIRRGHLPRKYTVELWQGGASFDHICDGCGAAIAPNEPMGLLCGENWSLMRFHLDCFQVWNSEKSVVVDTAPTA
jgi:hypothetical protein